MATSNRMRALNRLPFDFEDGLKVGGVDVTSLNQAFTPAGAGLIGFTPVGNLSAGNVQAALAELDNEKVGFARLDDTDGSSLVGYMPAGTGAVATTVQEVLRETVSVKRFGAKGDGVTDDTAAIQAAINALPVGGVLDGLGYEYVVTSLNLKSFMKMRNFRLKTKAGSTDFVSPITINGLTESKSYIWLEKINIDGNRQNQTSIDSPGEDGGRHGFRILGNVSNLYIIESTAHYCAGDGIELFSSSAAPANGASKCFNNIWIVNCQFYWNRRHGLSGDSINGIFWLNSKSKNNGKDLDTTSALNSGMRGSRYSGNLYGRPFDFEGYGVGSALDGVWLDNCDFRDNVAGGLFYFPTDAASSGYATNKNIYIENCRFSKSANPVAGDPNPSLTFSGGTNTGIVYENVVTDGCLFDGTPFFYNVKNLSAFGGFVSYHYNNSKALISKCTNWTFNVPSDRSGFTLDASLDFQPAVTFMQGNAATGSITSTKFLRTTEQGFYQVRIKATSLQSGSGPNNWYVDVPSGFEIIDMQATALMNSTGYTTYCSVAQDGNNRWFVSVYQSATNSTVVWAATILIAPKP